MGGIDLHVNPSTTSLKSFRVMFSASIAMGVTRRIQMLLLPTTLIRLQTVLFIRHVSYLVDVPQTVFLPYFPTLGASSSLKDRVFPLFSPSILGVFPLFLETPVHGDGSHHFQRPPSAVIRVRRFRNCCDNLVDPSSRCGEIYISEEKGGCFFLQWSLIPLIPNKQPTDAKKMGLVYYTYIYIYTFNRYSTLQNVGKYSGRTQILWVPILCSETLTADQRKIRIRLPVSRFSAVGEAINWFLPKLNNPKAKQFNRENGDFQPTISHL